jgi:hypothetical protein
LYLPAHGRRWEEIVGGGRGRLMQIGCTLSIYVCIVKGKMNKSLVFKRAWKEHNIKIKHNCQSVFGHCLKKYFRIARLLGRKYDKIPPL